jgi:hypothetical protein
MAERLFLAGKLTDLTDPRQLGTLNDLLSQLLAVYNSFDQNSFALSWIDGAAAGQVIASKGVGNAPEWDASPALTGATFSGLTASQLVVTTAGKALASLGTLTVALGGTGATTLTDNGVLFGNAAAAIGATAEGATGTLLTGVTGNPPAYSATPTVTTITGTTSVVGGTAGNTVTLTATGVTLAGTATVWDDIRITPGSFDRPGISDPAYVIYYPAAGALGLYLPEFKLNDFVCFTVQMPHSYKHGSDIYAHVHWTPGTRGNEENGHTVGWKLDYSWANIDGSFASMQTLDLSDACDGTDDKHQMTPEIVIDGHTAAKTMSSMLLCNLRRSDTGTDDTWATNTAGNLPLLLEVDFHYEMDTLGSNTQSSKT